MQKMNITAFVSILLVTSPAIAASPEAWLELFAKAGAACKKKAELKRSKIIGEQPILFQDRLLLVVEGHYPQPHMKNRKGKFYCLFNQETNTAEIAEAS